MMMFWTDLEVLFFCGDRFRPRHASFFQSSFGLKSAENRCCKEAHISEVKAVKPKMVEPWVKESGVVVPPLI